MKKDKDILPDEPLLKENPQRVYDKDTELYDTVLDDVVNDDDSEDNVEAEYEGVVKMYSTITHRSKELPAALIAQTVFLFSN